MANELKFAPLFSGSSGNSVYVGCGDTHILVDAGVSGTRVARELGKLGIPLTSISAILATHEHGDHISGIGVLSRRWDIPVYATEGTWAGMEPKVGAILPKNRRVLIPGEDFYLGDLNVTPFSTPHDANEPIGLTFSCGCARFSLATDLGCIRNDWMRHVLGSDAVLLESNYDPAMLESGPYTYNLKHRILSNRGHLCNDDAGKCAAELVRSGTKQLVLGHLSAENNFPELALQSCVAALRSRGIEPGRDVQVEVARRDCATGMFSISCDFD